MALLQAYLKANHLPSDRQAAKHLGIAQGNWSSWAAGMRPIPDARIIQIAKGAGIDPRLALAAIHAERADSDEVASYWRSLAELAAA